MAEITFEDIMQAVARGWCSDANKKKVMDTDLAMAISAEVGKLFNIRKQDEEKGI